jgi:probable H4MPT-linked C1 transfer pathway protein
MSRVIGLDIGGANIKAARPDGAAASRMFPLWKIPERLSDAVCEITAELGGASVIALTMTGELADCFRDRAEGVRRIVSEVQRALPHARIWTYTLDRTWADPATIDGQPDDGAATNWLALASWVATIQGLPANSLMIDCGSTTTDIVALQPNSVWTESRTDHDRLKSGELVYVGIGRTPICALCSTLPYRGRSIPVMNEVFATSDDVALLLGWIAEDPSDLASADGRPRDRDSARNRLARMVGLDHRQFSFDDAREAAATVADELRGRVAAAAAHVIRTTAAPELLICSGHGQALTAGVLADVPRKSLADLCGVPVDRVGPAYALAVLAHRDRLP